MSEVAKLPKPVLYNNVQIVACRGDDFKVYGYRRGTLDPLKHCKTLDEAFMFAASVFRQHAAIALHGPIIDDRHMAVVRFNRG